MCIAWMILVNWKIFGFYEYTEDCVAIVEWADKFPR